MRQDCPAMSSRGVGARRSVSSDETGPRDPKRTPEPNTLPTVPSQTTSSAAATKLWVLGQQIRHSCQSLMRCRAAIEGGLLDACLHGATIRDNAISRASFEDCSWLDPVRRLYRAIHSIDWRPHANWKCLKEKPIPAAPDARSGAIRDPMAKHELFPC